MEDLETMGVVQISKLAEWLMMQGHTAEEVVQCIDYIAGKKPEDKKREPDAVREVRTPNA